jgi:hypothetical protein
MIEIEPSPDVLQYRLFELITQKRRLEIGDECQQTIGF